MPDLTVAPISLRVSFGFRTVTAAAVILATGVNDDPPPIPGLAEQWGRGVYTCPFCDGFENQDKPLTVLGSAAWAPHTARMLLRCGFEFGEGVHLAFASVASELTSPSISPAAEPVGCRPGHTTAPPRSPRRRSRAARVVVVLLSCSVATVTVVARSSHVLG